MHFSESFDWKGHINTGIIPVFPADLECSGPDTQQRLCTARDEGTAECVFAEVTCGESKWKEHKLVLRYIANFNKIF